MRHDYRILAAAALVGLASPFVYVAAAALSGTEPGFPLDDAWIHQVFGASVAHSGVPAFNAGEPSTASTSPFWTLMLAAGIGLGLPAYAWTMLLGGASLAMLAGAVFLLARRLFPMHPTVGPLAALATVLEWHLAWAAASGMETVLFAAVTVLLVVLGSRSRFDPLVVGALAGVATLTRAEGAVLLAIVLVLRLVVPLGEADRGLVRRLLQLAAAGALALAVVAPYAVFSLAVSGSALPSTFAAKTAFYGRPVTAELTMRFVAAVLGQLATSPATILLPAAIVGGAMALGRQRSKPVPPEGMIAWWTIVLWSGAVLVLYLVRLPVVYQHGRYFIPLIPFAIVALVGGSAVALARFDGRRVRVIAVTTAIGAWAAMWWLGISAWLFDVRFIDGYQVAAGRWIAANTPEAALIATHDVGAIGLFGGRQVVDIAGLVTPEVVPIVRDGPALRRYLENRRVDYLVAFPDWVPGLTDDARLVEVARFWTPAVRAAGAPDLVIYRAAWR